MDDLKDLSLRNDGIVFDQMCFTHPHDRNKLNLTGDEIIKLLDMEVSRSISARYRNARIPRDMPRIFITNLNVTAGAHADRSTRLLRNCQNRSRPHTCMAGASIFPRGRNDEEQEGIDSRVRVSEYMLHDLRRNPGPNARGAAAAPAPHP